MKYNFAYILFTASILVSAATSPLAAETASKEEKKAAELQKRELDRETTRTAKLKQLKKIDCGFDKFKSWQDFLTFSRAAPPTTIKGEVLDFGISSVTLTPIGKVTKGPCAGGEILHAIYTDEQPDKTGPGPSYLLSDGFLTYGHSETESDAFNDPFQVILIKVRNHYLIGEGFSATLQDFLMDFGGDVFAYSDPHFDYRKYFFPKAEVVTFDKKKLNIQPYFSGRISIQGPVPDSAKKILSNPVIGDLYINSRTAQMRWPDGIWSEVYIGTKRVIPSYWFDDFLDDPKFESIKNIKLSALADDASTFELSKGGEKFLKAEYNRYLDRVKSLEEDIESYKAHTPGFNLTKLNYSDYKKKKPFLFFQDPLGRMQVHRLSLHEIPSLAEPLIYVYGPLGLRLDIKLCSNLVHKISWPAYGNSWSIQLLPDGLLWDLRNKKKIRTLFWEGFAGSIPPLEEAWVVKPDGVGSLLDKILPGYGLNPLEINDFKKYWVKALNQAPFYRIEIIPSEWMNSICPLSISPTPDQLIRVYLRAYPLQNFEEVREPKIPMPTPRSPFTVVEWGGFLE